MNANQITKILIVCSFFSSAFSISQNSYAMEESYPNRPITFIVPFPPGGPTDAIARVIAEKLAKKLRQPIIVANRPGAGGNIGVSSVMRSHPDGYTITLITTTSSAINPHLFSDLSYDPTTVLPIAIFATTDYVLVASKKLAIQTLNELIEKIKDKPGQMNAAYASTTSQVGNGILRQTFDLSFTDIPYKGDIDALTALMSGQIDFYFTSSPQITQFSEENRLLPLAVAARTRLDQLPKVPTFAEVGAPNFVDLTAWLGVATVKGTPASIIETLNTEINKIMTDAETTEKLTRMGFKRVYTSPKTAQDMLSKDIVRWKTLVTKANVKVQ